MTVVVHQNSPESYLNAYQAGKIKHSLSLYGTISGLIQVNFIKGKYVYQATGLHKVIENRLFDGLALFFDNLSPP